MATSDVERQATASVRILHALVAAAQADGASLEALLARAELDASVLESSDGRVPYRHVLAMFEAAATETSDPDWGLNAPAKIDPGYFGLLAYLARHSDNLYEAIDQVSQAGRVVLVEGGDAYLRDEGDVVALGYSYPPYTRELRHSQEFAMSLMVLLARLFTGSNITPLEVRFPHTEPANTTRHHAIFRCSVLFGQDAAEMLLPRSVVELPFQDADKHLVGVLEGYTAYQLAELNSASVGFDQRVTDTISLALGGGAAPGVRHVAKKLGISTRTLQRRLRGLDTTFAKLVDAARRNQALSDLLHDELTMTAVALRAGYSDVSAFHRAFKRWTGQTPAAYRAAGKPSACQDPSRSSR